MKYVEFTNVASRLYRCTRCIGYQVRLDKDETLAYVQLDNIIDIGDIKLIKYNPQHNPRISLTITEYDYGRLSPGEYLNDTIVDFYLRYADMHN
jgi:hypothetical protein